MKKNILLTFVLLMVGGLSTLAAAAPDGEAGNEDYWSGHAASTFASQDESAKTLSISTPAQLALLAKNVNSGTSYAGYTITISGTLDMGAHYWIPINARNGQLSGSKIQGSNTAVISNLKIDKAVYTGNYDYYAGFIAQTVGNLTVQDLTFSGAVSVANGSGVATVLGLTYGNVLFDNVKIENSTITATTKAGALVGFTGGDGITVTVKDCTLDNVTVKAEYSYALMVGLVNTSDHVVFEGNCSATDSRAEIDETAVTNDFPTRKTIKGYTYGVDDNKLWVIGVQDAWAECRTNPTPKKMIDGVEYSVMGDIFYHANNVIVDVCTVAKIGDTEYASLAEAVNAAETADVVEIINDGTYTIPNLSNNITIKADKDLEVVFNCLGSGSIASIPNGATFEGVTFNMGQSGYHGFQHAGTINMNNCTLNGLFFSYGDMNFNSCKFIQTTGEYMMWDYAGNISYTNCTFNGKGKFLNIYNEVNGSWKISVAGCTFKSDTKNKAPLNIKETCGAILLPFEVTIGEGNTLENSSYFPENSTSDKLIVSGDGLWQVDDRCSDHTQSKVVVKDAQGNILYEAKSAEGAAEEIKVDYGLDITSNEGDSELTEEEKTKAEEAIKGLASNTEASTLPEGTKKSNNAAVKTDVLADGQSVIVNIEIKSAQVNTATDGIVIKKVTFDVTPYVTISDVAKNKIDNENIQAPITFRLPVSEDVAYNCAEVFHEGTSIGIKKIEGETNGKYLEISSKEFSEFSYVLMSEPTSVKYYLAKNEEKDDSFTAFTEAAKTCKNAIAIVSSDYAEFAAANTNVLVECDNDANGKSYVCPKFVLTDLEDFYSPVDFVAEAGSYTRIADNVKGMNSVCLPFAITKANVNDGKIGTYKSSNITNGTGTISFEEVNSIGAGVPCIVECTGGVAWEINFNNTEIKATIDDSNPIKGAYIKKELGAGFFKVSSDGTKFVNTVDRTSHAWPFRAYLDLTTQAAAKELTIEWNDGSTTGINTIDNGQLTIDNSKAYNLNGMRVNDNYKGIVIMNGKKYIK